MIQIDIQMPRSCSWCPFCVNTLTDAVPLYGCPLGDGESIPAFVDDGDGKPIKHRPDWCRLKYSHAILNDSIAQESNTDHYPKAAYGYWHVYDPLMGGFVSTGIKASVNEQTE